MSSKSPNNGKEYLLQKNRLYVEGFGADQSFEEIRDFCIEHGKERVMYMTRYREHAVFPTYKDEEAAEKAMQNFKLNHVKVNYARLPPNRVARMESNGIKVNATPESKPERKHRTLFGAGCLIRIIKTTDSDKIFVLVKTDWELYKQFMDDVNKMASGMKPLNGMPQSQEIVVAPYEGKFYRAVVNKEVPDEAGIVDSFLVDIVKRSLTHYSNLKKMPRNFQSTQGFGPKVHFVHQFQLARLTTSWPNNSYVTDCLKKYIGTEWKMSSSDDSNLKPYAKIELTNPNNTVTNLNTLIKKLAEDTFTVDSLVERKVSVGPNKQLVVIDNSNLKNDSDNLVTFCHRMDWELFVCIQDSVQRCGHVVAELPIYSPKTDEVCIVKIESLWYRAIFSENNVDNEDEAWVQLVDNAVLVSVKKDNIRKINGTCVKLEIVSFVGKIDGFGDKIESTNIDELCKRFKNEATVAVKAVKDVGDAAFLIEI